MVHGAKIVVFYVISAYIKDKIEKIEEKGQDLKVEVEAEVEINLKIVKIIDLICLNYKIFHINFLF